MPIIQPTENTAPVFFPESNYEIVKYMDLTRYISLLHRQALFFCRLDKLDDHFEGTTTKANFNYKVSWYKHMREKEYLRSDMTDDEIIEKVKKEHEDLKKFKSIFCVNCWNKEDGESAALWKIYSDFNKGIMIKSTITRLHKSFATVEKEIQLSEIHYLDYGKEMIPDFNLNYPVIHKDIAYRYEDEVRLIHFLNKPYWEFDWSKQEVEEGMYIRTDLNELIDEIIISPYSPKWFFKLIQDVSIKYSIIKPIKKSRLSIEE